MRFQVPQFIEIEDKIFGPLTLKQFIYLAGGAGLAFLVYTALPIFLALPVDALVVALALALAFYKINNKPFVIILEAAFRFFFSNKLYIWRKENRKITPTAKSESDKEPLLSIPRLSDSKLKDLAWSLDVHEVSNPGVSEMYKEYKQNRV